MKTPAVTAKHPQNVKKAHVNTMTTSLGRGGNSKSLTGVPQPSVKAVIMGVCTEGNLCWVR